MKHYFLRSLGLLALCSIAWTSCTNDEEPVPQDTEKPAILFSTIPDETIYSYNTVAITGAAADNVAVTKVQVFLDNATTPFKEFANGTIDLPWDTRVAADGDHTLRFVAFDDQNNQAEKILKVKVRNTLVSFMVPEQFLQSNNHNYIFIANEQGEVLDTKELHNGETYKFKAPDNFTGQTLTLNLFEYTENETYEDFCYIYSYSKTPFGDYRYNKDGSPAVGPATTESVVKFTDAVEGDMQKQTWTVPYGTDLSFMGAVFKDGEGLQYTFGHRTDESAVLFTALEDNELKYLATTLKPDDHLEVSMADRVNANRLTITAPEAPTILLTQIGTNEYGDFGFTRSKTVTHSNGGIPAYVIGDVFDTYVTQVRHRYSGYDNFHYYRGQVPAAVKQINAQIGYKLNGSSTDLTITGTADAAYVAGSESISQQLFTSWTVYIPSTAGTTTVKAPALPQFLVDTYHIKSFAELPSKSATVLDYTGVTGYSEYINANFAIGQRPEVNEYTARVQYTAATGGRVGNSDERMEWPHLR
jgi:hypothetical protein